MTAEHVVWLLICSLVASLSLCSLLGKRDLYEDPDRNHDEGDPK